MDVIIISNTSTIDLFICCHIISSPLVIALNIIPPFIVLITMVIILVHRASDLDEAMYRRISLAIEFRKPDHILRERIWRSLCPPKLQLADDVDVMELALKYELTGKSAMPTDSYHLHTWNNIYVNMSNVFQSLLQHFLLSCALLLRVSMSQCLSVSTINQSFN
jgi:hypothetical protein